MSKNSESLNPTINTALVHDTDKMSLEQLSTCLPVKIEGETSLTSQKVGETESSLIVSRDANNSKINIKPDSNSNENDVNGNENTTISGDENVVNIQNLNTTNNNGITGIQGNGHTINKYAVYLKMLVELIRKEIYKNKRMKPKKNNTLVTFNIEKDVKPQHISLQDYPAEIQSILAYLKEHQLPVVIMVNVVNQTNTNGLNVCGDNSNINNIKVNNENCPHAMIITGGIGERQTQTQTKSVAEKLV